MQISEDQAQEVSVHERRIAQTRSDMSDTVSELQDRLSPGTLAGNAGNAVKDATIGRGSRLMGDLTDRVKANPVPAALIGAGIAWMWMSGRKKDDDDYYARGLSTSSQPRYGSNGVGSKLSSAGDRMSSAMSDTADTMQGAVANAADTARTQMNQVGLQAQRAQLSVQQMVQENPLPVALAAAGVGALIAAAVPTSTAEQRMMQPVGEQLSQQASQLGSKVGRVADRAKDAARDEAQRQNLS